MHNEQEPAAALAGALAGAGWRFRVEGRGTLAVLHQEDGAWHPLTEAERLAVVAMARTHGFTHAALEIPDATT